jgi:hypothetical protein
LIWRSSASAGNFSDKIFICKFRTYFYLQISDKFLSANFGQIFICKFRTNFYLQISDKFFILKFLIDSILKFRTNF